MTISAEFYFNSFSLFISLLAKLDKADRALCFTSGMAALAAVTHLVGTGAFIFFLFFLFIYISISFY